METIIVFIDDADYAVQMLQPMLPATNLAPTRWVWWVVRRALRAASANG